MSTPVFQTSWTGHYYDGRTPTRFPVTITIAPNGLELQLLTGTRLWWPYHEVTQSQGGYDNEPVRLEWGSPIAEALVVDDPKFLVALSHTAQRSIKGLSIPRDRTSKLQILVLATVGSIAALAGLVVWGIPALAELVTPFIPVSWEVALGESVVERMAPPDARCTNSQLQDAITTVVTRLQSNAAVQPYKFNVMVLDKPVFNAFAAPGGFILLLQPLVEATKTPEELAGVLAHEMQHILQRHAMKGLVQDLSIGLMVGAILGDVSGIGAFGVQAARTLTTLNYSRDTEEEADRKGMQLMKAAHIDAGGMVSFFTTLKTKEGGITPPAYLSTHPDTTARIEALKRLAATQEAVTPEPLLPHIKWDDVKKLCR
jgi:Zn-dependent protease with chaperone function